LIEVLGSAVLPPDLAGKTFLGINCLKLCRLARAAGALSVDCILPDGDIGRVSPGDTGINILPLSDGIPANRKWDHVVSDAMLSRSRHPFGDLAALAKVTASTLTISVSPIRFLGMKAGALGVIAGALRALPVVIAGNNGSTGKSQAPKFFFSPRSLKEIFLRHRSDFASLEFIKEGGKLFARAEKRRIGHLIVVSGPVAAGKTTFIERLLSGKLPEVVTRLGIKPGERPPVLGTSSKAPRTKAELPVAISHYGFLRPYMRPAAVCARDEALDVIDVAERVTVVTLQVGSDALVERITRGEIDAAPGGKASQRHLQLREEYRNPQRLVEHYDRWIKYVEGRGLLHFLAAEDAGKVKLVEAGGQSLADQVSEHLFEWPLREADQRQDFAVRALPQDMTGLTLLDVDCETGEVCRLAKERGAARVVGIDPSADVLAEARHRCPGVEFRQASLWELPPGEKFDVVTCRSRLSYERDVTGFLDALIAKAGRHVAFGFSSMDDGSRKRTGLPWIAATLLAKLPIIFALKNGTASNREQPRFAICKPAMSRMLTRHRKTFSEMSFRTYGSGTIVSAEKFRIPHLIVVAGPVSAGKSTLCNMLVQGRADFIYEKLGVDKKRQPKSVYLPRARSSGPPTGECVLFHYNMLNAYVSTAAIHENDENLDIMRLADRLSVLTVWARPEQLVQQITKSEIDKGPFHRPTRRHLQLREEYRNPARVRFHYESWNRFVSNLTAENWMIVRDSEGAPHMQSVAEWRHETQSGQA
jgi:2-polyprenyl-3-methyl-5-hydroxy-6-metoxy-1,4-benzoquinol methylase/GTPase SAR1 family protein